jgi:hypothetical protein
MDMYQDFLLNHDLTFDKAIRCHSNFDFSISYQGDTLLTTTNGQAVLQKIFLLMGIKPGEVPGDPELGWCLFKYFYKSATGNTFAQMDRDVKYQFESLIPELGVKYVKCESMGNDYGRVDGVKITIISNDYGKIVLNADRSLSGVNIGNIPTEAFQ